MTKILAIAAMLLPVSAAEAEARVNRWTVVAPHNDRLNRIARCESGGRWFLNGLYDGGLQFNPGTWTATGSHYRFAFLAPVIEQKYRAVLWAKRIGWRWSSTAGWPVCGR